MWVPFTSDENVKWFEIQFSDFYKKFSGKVHVITAQLRGSLEGLDFSPLND